MIVAPAAERDLREISAHLREIAGDDIAERFIGVLTDRLFEIADHGLSGTPRDWISPGLRMTVFRDRCIYFRVLDAEVHILRVIHGRRDRDSMGLDAL